MSPKVFTVVLNWNGSGDTSECVDSDLSQTGVQQNFLTTLLTFLLFVVNM